MQGALDCRSESSGIMHSYSSIPSNTDANIESEWELLPQNLPRRYLAIDTEIVSNSQTINDAECMQIDTDHDRHVFQELSQSSSNDTPSIEDVKIVLCVKEFKEFQIKTIDAVAQGNDVILVQPTGSGKSLLYHSCFA